MLTQLIEPNYFVTPSLTQHYSYLRNLVEVEYDFESNLVYRSTSKFFKDNKIALGRRASAICNLEKFTRVYLHQIAREMMLLLINYLHEKASQKVKTDEILTARALFVICTRVT